MQMKNYKMVANDKLKRAQIVYIEPIFRQPSEFEREYILKNWSVVFKDKKPSIFSNIFSLFMAAIGVLFCCLTIATIFIEFIVSLIFALITAGLIITVMASYKSSKRAIIEYNNLQNGFFTVSDAIATNLELIWSYRETDNGRLYAYVNILNNEQVSMVENVEIPAEIAEDFFQRNVKEFPCLLISIKNKNDLLAIPKIIN